MTQLNLSNSKHQYNTKLLHVYLLFQLTNYCNSSRCQVISFNFSEFPSYITTEALHAFRPIIIQVSNFKLKYGIRL